VSIKDKPSLTSRGKLKRMRRLDRSMKSNINGRRKNRRKLSKSKLWKKSVSCKLN